MSAVPTDYKRLFLRSLKWDAEDSSLSLLDTLKIAARARISETSKGKVLVGTAANGKSASFAIPAGSINNADLVCLCGEMVDRHEEAIRLLAARTVPIASPTQTQIFDEMLALLQPAYSVCSDYSFLRFL